MKRINIFIASIVAFAVVLVFAADYTQVKQTRSGYQIGTGTNQAVGFYGASPVVRPAGYPALTNTFADAALTQTKQTNTSVQAALTLATFPVTNVVDGTTNVINVITGVTVNTVFGFGEAGPLVTVSNVSVNSLAGFSSTTVGSNTVTFINAIRAALVNLGLMKATQ